MNDYVMKVPDVGEGVAQAELVEWHVAVGDIVTPDTPVAEVLTDKATVEIYAAVGGIVAALHGEPGDVLAVGSDLLALTVEADPTHEHDGSPPDADAEPELEIAAAATGEISERPTEANQAAPGRISSSALASPAVRTRATALGLDLAQLQGTGPNGQIIHADLDRCLTSGSEGGRSAVRRGTSELVRLAPVRGLRRRIAERLVEAWTQIPHIIYVDSVDATELELLRAELNARQPEARLTLLPFVVRALARAVSEQPRLNAHYDAAAASLSIFDAVHVGIATQTSDGLVVPVIRHAERLGLAELAPEIARLAAAARAGNATRDELTGSTITITSLGRLGGLATTPIINPPEVAIIGINRLEVRPEWRAGAVVPRQMFNLSASFDHRIVDGWDAAVFVQRIKSQLEMPTLLFMDVAHDAT